MHTSSIIGLVNNAALLLALGLLYEFIANRLLRDEHPILWQMTIAIVPGAIGIAIMLNPWEFGQGVVFDTRSVMLCLTGYILGALPAGLAMLMTAAFRLYQGGTGMWTGVAVIVTSGGIGLAWRYLRRNRKDDPTVLAFYFFGVVVHLAMLLWMLTLPGSVSRSVLSHISLPVMVIYPFTTAVLGKLMVNLKSRRTAEIDLREREQFLRTVLQTTVDGFCVLDIQGNFLEVNHAYCTMTGFSRDEIIGKKISDIDVDETPKDTAIRVARIMTNGSEIFETCHCRKDGSIFPVEVSTTFLQNNGGRFICFFRDQTERVQREKRIGLLGRILDTAPVLITIHDAEGRIHYANQASITFHGYDSETEFLSINLQEIDVPESQALQNERMRSIIENGEARFEVRHHRKDGSSFPLDILAKAIEWDHHPAILCIAADITQRKQAEAAISHSYDLMRYIIEHVKSAVAVHDRDLRYIYVSQRYLDEYHVKERNIIGKHHYDVFPDLPEKWREVHRKALAGQVSSAERDDYLRDDGTIEWTRWECRPWYESDGSIGGIIVYTEVITERVAAEEALRKSEESQRAMITASPLAIVSLTPDGYVLSWNAAAERIFGWKADEVIGKLLPIVSGDQHEAFTAFRQRVMTGEILSQIELTRQRKDGNPVEISLSTAPLRDRECRITAIMATIEDITERKQAEKERDHLQAQLLQAQKMESVGRLAGGVAHDYNNMLSVILGYAELSLEKVSPQEELYSDLQEIQNAAKRSSEITRQLLAFSRQQTIAPKSLDLNDTVEGMIKMLLRLLGEDIHLVWNPGNAPCPVRMDPAQLDQILVNLCVNARDAISDVGKINIETDIKTFDDTYCTDHVGFLPGDYVMLSVSDDGCGMDGKTLDRLFEPFFTTKEIGKGTGLGLATVYGIVRQNNGFINVYSEPGQGTTFRIYLPRCVVDVDSIPVSNTAQADLQGNETILLVEDEPTILKLATLMLERLGYGVLTAGTPANAIALSQACSDRIHLLMTDVVMPGMNGRELAERLQTIHPDIKVLFMSGYTANVIAHRGVLYEGVNFIQKPFSMKELSLTVRESLDK
jgi:PAS domain S-box-containing protein